MKYQWKQQSTRKNERQYWILVDRECQQIVMNVRLPVYATARDANRFKRKCLVWYTWLYEKSMLDKICSIGGK